MSVWVSAGENRVASILFGTQAVDSTLYLGVFTAPTSTPATNSTIVSLTEPSTANGYARIALTRGTWVVTGGNATYAQQSFTCSNSNWGNVYGYFIATVSSGTAGILMGAEAFQGAPYNIIVGNVVSVNPQVSIV